MTRIGECIGRWVACPDPLCGARSEVRPSRGMMPRSGAMPPPGVMPGGGGPGLALGPDDRHVILVCPRTGSKLFRREVMVEVLGDE